MNLNLFKGNTKRTKIFTLITVISIVLLLALNFLLTYFGAKNTLFFDLTKEGLYTVSDTMEKECDEIFSELKKTGDEKVRITFCTDPDYLMQAQTTRLSYILALKLSNMYPDSIELKAVNVTMNPTAVAEYKATSLSEIAPSDIIVSYGGRYRIMPASRFWVNGTEKTVYFNGEYRFASLIKSVTAISKPSAYFITGHGEKYYDESAPDSAMSLELYEFYNLLESRGLDVKTLDLSTVERVPDDCALLILNNPTSDFEYDPDRLDELSYVTDLEKIDRYLVMKQGALMFAKDYSVSLPNLENFLSGWGFSFGDTLVKDEENSLEDEDGTNTVLITKYDSDPESYGYAIYGEYADLSSAPVTVIENAGSISSSFPRESLGTVTEQGGSDTTRNYVSFLTTHDTGRPFGKNSIDGEYTSPAGDYGTYDLAALSVRSELNTETGEHVFSYVFCVNSPDFFSGKYLSSSSSYANYDIVSALVDNISRIDEHASIDLGGTSLNSLSGGGKKLIASSMSETGGKIYSNKYVNNDKSQGLVLLKNAAGISSAEITFFSILIFAIPLLVAVAGVVVTVKRRFL